MYWHRAQEEPAETWWKGPSFRGGNGTRRGRSKEGLDPDPLVDSLQLPIALGRSHRAGRTGLGPGLDDVVRMQLSSHAGATALPPLTRTRVSALCQCLRTFS